jgi:LEA14-like dessication related protein
MIKSFLTVLPILSACAGTPKAAPKAEIGIDVDRIMPLADSLDASAVEVTLLLTNPDKEPIKVTGVTYEIDTGDVAGVLKGEADADATIESQQEVEVKFKQSIPFPEEIEAYKEILDRRTVPVKLKGQVKLSDGRVVDFARLSEVATPTLPKFVVHDAQAARYGKEGIDVTLFLRLINENVFGVMIEGVDYTVSVNGKEIKSEQAAVGVRLIAAGAQEFEVGSVLDEETLGKERVKEILAARAVSYKVTGKVEIQRLTIPFDYDGEIKLATGE